MSADDGADDKLEADLALIARALREAAREDARLRSALARVGGWLGALNAALDASRTTTPSPPPAPESAPTEALAEPPRREPIELRIGEAVATVAVSGPAAEIAAVRRALEERSKKPHDTPSATAPSVAPRPEPRLPDLTLVARRARLKAEACRWAITRRRRLDEGADFEQTIKPADQELGRRARALPECRTWSLDPYAELPDDKSLEDLAGSYDALAAAADLAHDVQADEEHGGRFRESAYHLLAEAQSALRAGLALLASVKIDQDQIDTFTWLRVRTFEDQVYIARFMRLDDAAAPAAWLDRGQRIDELRQRFEKERDVVRRRTQLVNKLRFHAQRVAHAVSDEGGLGDWQRVIETLELLVAGGVRPSDVEVRDLMLPLVERFPEGLATTPGFERVRAEVDRYLASREDQEQASAPARAPTPELEEARRLLRGKRVVLIGGQERRRSREALERELGLCEVRWISADAHQPLSIFEAEIARPETALVLLAIRWSSHSYEGVKAYCKQYGKAFVRLPRGYSPNQVAHEIVQQVSEQLR